MKFSKKLFNNFLFLFSVMISATSVANPVADLFQLLGSIKVSDVVFMLVLSILLFSNDFYTRAQYTIRAEPFVTLLVFLFLIFIIISIFGNIEFSSERMLAHLFRYIYYIGIIFTFVYISTYYIPIQKIFFSLYMGGFVMCSSVLYLMFFQDMGLMYGNGIRKLDSVLGANPVATYAAIIFPIGLYLAREASGFILRGFYVTSTSLIVLAALLAESKAAWLAITCSFIIFFVFQDFKRKMYIAALVFMIFLIFFEDIYSIVMLEINTSGSNSMQRLDMFMAAMDYLLENLLTGIGPSNFIVISPYGTEPHSAYALIFAELGLFGGLTYIFLIITMIIRLLKYRQDKVSQLLIMLMVNIGVLSLFTGLVSTQIIFYILIGLYLGHISLLKMKYVERYYVGSE